MEEGLLNLPNQINLLTTASDIYSELNNYNKSLEYSKCIIKNHSDKAIGYKRTIKNLLKLNLLEEARKEIEKGLKKIPNQTDLLFLASDVYRKLKNIEKSLEYSKLILNYNPKDWKGYVRNAQDLISINRFIDADIVIEKGLNETNNNFRICLIKHQLLV